MLCTVLKPFILSEDGVTGRSVAADDVVNVPDDMVEGLVAEKFITLGTPVYETKVIERAPNVGPAVNLDDDSQGLSLREIHADLTAAHVDFDPRDDRDALLAQREAARAAREVPAADAYPNLSEAQEKALDRDGDDKPGGAPKGGNKRGPKAER